MKQFIFFLFLVCLLPLSGHAQVDPVLTGMIIEFTKKAESQYNAQLKLMGAESAGHIWLNEEVGATKDLQKQFDDYPELLPQHHRLRCPGLRLLL